MKTLLLAIIICLSAPTVYALEFHRGAEGQTILTFKQNGKTVYERIGTGGDGWPELEERRYYNAPEETSSKLQGLTPIEPDKVPYPQFNHELRGSMSGSSGNTLWEVKNEWNWDWELKYSKWITENLTPDFFTRARVATACSDIAYDLRWIFTRENNLPAANHLTTGELFTQRSVRDSWQHLPSAKEWYNDQRFRAALNYLNEHTFTHTLWADSYPILINKDSLIPGAYHVNKDKDHGHTMVVWRVSDLPQEIPVVTLSSTTPRAVRDLDAFMYLEAKSDIRHLALLRMRWPVFKGNQLELTPSDQMPSYSLEQFSPSFVAAPRTKFWEEIFNRIDPNLNFEVIAVKSLQQLIPMFQKRVNLVTDGYAHCSHHQCPTGSQGYEDWSTDSRDNRIQSVHDVFEAFQSKAEDKSQFGPLLDQVIVHVEGRDLTLDQASYLIPYLEQNAKLSVWVRWGLSKLPFYKR